MLEWEEKVAVKKAALQSIVWEVEMCQTCRVQIPQNCRVEMYQVVIIQSQFPQGVHPRKGFDWERGDGVVK